MEQPTKVPAQIKKVLAMEVAVYARNVFFTFVFFPMKNGISIRDAASTALAETLIFVLRSNPNSGNMRLL